VRQAVLAFTDELVLAPGLWKMRNGHTAEVLRRQDIPYTEGNSRKPAIYTVWHGRCLECQTPMSWTINGCYAAVGRHQNDILEAA